MQRCAGMRDAEMRDACGMQRYGMRRDAEMRDAEMCRYEECRDAGCDGMQRCGMRDEMGCGMSATPSRKAIKGRQLAGLRHSDLWSSSREGY